MGIRVHFVPNAQVIFSGISMISSWVVRAWDKSAIWVSGDFEKVFDVFIHYTSCKLYLVYRGLTHCLDKPFGFWLACDRLFSLELLFVSIQLLILLSQPLRSLLVLSLLPLIAINRQLGDMHLPHEVFQCVQLLLLQLVLSAQRV